MKKNLQKVKKTIKSNLTSLAVLMVIIIAASLTPLNSIAQSMAGGSPDSTKAVVKPAYPRVVGYLSFILPLETFSSGSFTPDFNGTTKIGFPVGVNVLYSDKFGFSYEITPTLVKVANSEPQWREQHFIRPWYDVPF